VPENQRYPCNCCGFDTLDEEPPGTFAICRICDWEDDDLQARKPDYAGGANKLCLRDAQRGWLQSSYNHPTLQTEVTLFGKVYRRAATWKPLP